MNQEIPRSFGDHIVVRATFDELANIIYLYLKCDVQVPISGEETEDISDAYLEGLKNQNVEIFGTREKMTFKLKPLTPTKSPW